MEAENATGYTASYFNDKEIIDGRSISECDTNFTFGVHVVLNTVIALIGLVGNSLTCAVAWKDRNISTTAFLLINLAIADDLVIVTFVYNKFVQSLCKYIPVGACVSYLKISNVAWYYGWIISSSVHMVATWSIVAISFTRFVSVCWVTKAPDFTKVPRLKVQIAIMWVLCFIFNIPRYFEKKISEQETGSPKMKLTSFGEGVFYRYVYAIFLHYLFIYVMPLGLLMYFTYHLIRSLHEWRKKRENLTSKARDKADITFSLVIVIVIFVISQCISPTRRLVLQLTPENAKACGSAFYYFTNITDKFIILNSATNFFIFCVCAKRFRKSMKELFMHNNKVHVVPHNGSSRVFALTRNKRTPTEMTPAGRPANI